MNIQYNFAIIGCGKIAKRHADEIQKRGKLIAVCDVIAERAAAFANLFAANPYCNIDELLGAEGDLDIAVICTPNGLHATHSIRSLQSGRHVLCEKPMAIKTTDARKMIEAEKSSGKKLFVVKQNRYNPPVAYVKQLISANKLGKIVSFDLNCFWNRPPAYYNSPWKGTMELDGGILFTQFSHFIDLLYWLLGDISSSSGMRRNYLHRPCIQFEDSGVAVIEMSSGAIGTINYTINSTNKNMEGSLILFGEKGTVKIGGQYLNELEYFSVEGEVRPELPPGKPANEYGLYQGSMSNHDKVYDHMLRALADPAHIFINSEETLKTIEIIEKIYQSSPLIT